MTRPESSQARPVGAAGASLMLRGPGLDPTLLAKRERLEATLRAMGRTLVAYSGGVDSTLLLAEAHRVLGLRALGVIAKSPSLAGSELESALDLAQERGIPVRVIETDEMAREGYRANGRDRCYHCKAELFDRLLGIARVEGWTSLAYGAVTDDLGDDRPGMAAANRYRARAPLLECGLGKLDVRILARAIGLRVWDKPQSACLASRIPHGMEVTAAKLEQVERGEAWLKEAFGLRVVRLRHHGAAARIEAHASELPRLTGPEALASIRLGLARLGFSEIVIDPAGYRRPDPQPT